MIWSYYWVKHDEQYPLWPNQIWAIGAMDSRTYYRGIFRLLGFSFESEWTIGVLLLRLGATKIDGGQAFRF